MTDPDTATAVRILIADDQPDVVSALRLLLKPDGYAIISVSSAACALEAVMEHDFDAVLMDLNYVRGSTSGREGLDLLSTIRRFDSTLPVIVMTAWSSVELAVEAMHRGARDFVPKPWKNERLLAILRTQVELSQALRKQRRLEQENLALRVEAPRLIAESRAMRPVIQAITRVGPSDANVLITGDNGSGKGVVAQTLYAASSRREGSLVTVNTASIPETVFESELFGHTAGAFTDAKSDRMGRFKLADGGTLFLDEIATIPPNLQAKLLRVLESGEFEVVGSSRTSHVNVRVFSATNADLDREITEGRFRQDLLYRLNTVTIHVPPLRQRMEDVPLLASHFLGRYVAKYRKNITGLDAASQQTLLDHPWPGNVRELDHTIERAVLMAQGTLIQPSDLGLGPKAGGGPRYEEMTLEQAECLLVQKALTHQGGDISKTAKALGLSRSALYRRLDKYGLTAES